MLRHGWRTGAIVPELEVETKVVNTEQYAQSLTWLQALTGLLERMQVLTTPPSMQIKKKSSHAFQKLNNAVMTQCCATLPHLTVH